MGERKQNTSLRRASRILAAFGANPALWPPADREWLGDRIDRDSGLAARAGREGALDALLAPAPAPALPASLTSRIRLAARMLPGPRQSDKWIGTVSWLSATWPLGGTWRGALLPSAAALVMAAALGLAAGTLPAAGTDDDIAQEFVLWAFGPIDSMLQPALPSGRDYES